MERLLRDAHKAIAAAQDLQLHRRGHKVEASWRPSICNPGSRVCECTDVQRTLLILLCVLIAISCIAALLLFASIMFQQIEYEQRREAIARGLLVEPEPGRAVLRPWSVREERTKLPR